MEKKYSIKASTIKNFFLILLLVRPQMITSYNAMMSYLFNGVQAFILIIFGFKMKLHKDLILTGTVLLFAYQVINNVMQGGTKSYIFTVISGMYAVTIIQILYNSLGKNEFFSMMARSFSFLLIINFLMAAFGINLQSTYHNREVELMFLGRYNQVTCYICIAILLLVLDNYINHKNREFVLLLIGVLMNVFYVDAATLVICIAIIFVSLFVGKHGKRLIKVINPLTVSIILFVIFYILTISINFGFAEKLFFMLGKDATLSQRTEIWKQSYIELSNPRNMLFGFGERSGGAYITIWTGNTFSGHNLIVQLLLEGGLILLYLYLRMYAATMKGLNSIENINEKVTICLMLFTYYIACMTEVFPIYMNLAVIYFVYLYCKSEKEQHDKENKIVSNNLKVKVENGKFKEEYNL